MLKDYRKDKYETTMKKVIERLKSSGYTEIKADYEDLESPAKLVSKKNDEVYIPDATAKNKLGNKAYFEVGRKISASEKLVNKWKLLETLASIKNGVFQIFVPHGSMKFTQEIITKYHINADLVKI